MNNSDKNHKMETYGYNGSDTEITSDSTLHKLLDIALKMDEFRHDHPKLHMLGNLPRVVHSFANSLHHMIENNM